MSTSNSTNRSKKTGFVRPYRPKKRSLGEVWDQCEPIFQNVLVNLQAGLDKKIYMATYSLIFNYLCSASEFERNTTHRVGEPEIYQKVRTLFEEYVQDLHTQFQNLSAPEKLVFFNQKWSDYQLSRKLVNGMLIYLNRTWIKSLENQPNIYPIHQLADVIWRDHFLIPNNELLTELVLNLIRAQRDGSQINESLISAVTQSYLQVGLAEASAPTQQVQSTIINLEGSAHLKIYQNHFERSLLKQTEQYYHVESSRYLQQNGIDAFLLKVKERLTEETLRSQNYLHASTKPKLVDILRQALVYKHREAMYHQFVPYLQDKKQEELAIMYELLNLLRDQGSLLPLYESFQQFITSIGEQSLSDQAQEVMTKPEVFAEIMITLFRRFTCLIREAFENDTDFVISRDKAFREFMNHNVITAQDTSKTVAKIPQLLARYADLILKKGPHHISEEGEMEAIQSDLVTIFSYLPDKDIFIMAYSKLMSRRLINDTSANDDYEVGFITKLKTNGSFECGAKLQKMIQDMETSKDLNSKFVEFREQLAESGYQVPKLDFQIHVLATSVWPVSPPPTNFILPTDLVPMSELFLKFYKTQHDGRKLCYLHHLSKLDIQTKTIMKGRLRLNTSVYQGALLLAFQETNRTTYGQLLSTTGLNEQAIKVALLGLLKIGLLKVNNKNHAEWADETLFGLNTNFKSKKVRVNCNMPVNIPGLTSQQQGHQTAVEPVEIRRERELKLQASIVRIMKARKTLKHNDLITETTDQVIRWFRPEIGLIKRTIEFLIEQEYLERVNDKDGIFQREYRYLA